MFRLSGLTALAAAAMLAAPAAADIVVGWTIASAFPTNPPPTGTFYSVGAADQGANITGSSLSSTHASATTAFTSPSGNGSQYSFSSNSWAIGDYYEARFSSAGFTDLSLSWDQARSSTGPVNFELVMSLDGGANFITLISSYAVLQSGGGGSPGTWSTGTYLSIYTATQALGSLADNQADVILRFRALSAPGGVSGSNRLDNVFISGTAVPAPGGVLVAMAAGMIRRRRRA